MIKSIGYVLSRFLILMIAVLAYSTIALHLESCAPPPAGDVCQDDARFGNLNTCDDRCVDLETDDNNCGECGNECESDESCVEGNCTATCSQGQISCDGTCVDLETDEGNCGECGNECGNGQSCMDGTCSSPCSQGLTDCSSVCVDLNTDEANCGMCGHECFSMEVCTSGICTP